MNRETAKEILPIIEAFAEGKTIQERTATCWKDSKYPRFDRPPDCYRIKPEPLEFDFWISDQKDDAGRPYGVTTANMTECQNWRKIRVREIIE